MNLISAGGRSYLCCDQSQYTWTIKVGERAPSSGVLLRPKVDGGSHDRDGDGDEGARVDGEVSWYRVLGRSAVWMAFKVAE